MSVLGQKSLLAKLMATENLTIQQSKVATASFDVKNRILTVPVLDNSISKDLYDLFMGHEVGHALYTHLDGMKKAKADNVNMSVLNVVEDSRIERKIKNKYPGIKVPFIRAYGELFERNFFETKGKKLSEYNLIDRINLHCKIGASLALTFNDIERELLRKVETTETFDEVIEVTKLLCDYMQQQSQEFLEQEEIEIEIEIVSGDEIEENSEKDGDVKVKAKNASSDDTDTEEGELKSDDNTDSEQNKESGELPKQSNSSNGAGRNLISVEIRSHTDDAYHKNEEQLFSKDDDSYVYANIPVFDTSKIVDYTDIYELYKSIGSFKVSDFVSYRRESNKIVSYLVKEFELRKNADQMKRATTSKTGELNLNRIYAYNFTDDIFKKMTVVPNGKSHGLVMFLDWSGSMFKHIGNTIKQLLNLALFCKKVNIPFEVYSFLDSTEREFMYSQKNIKTGDLFLGKFALFNILSSRMNATAFSEAAAILMNISGAVNNKQNMPFFMQMNGTPLNESIIAAMEIVPEFQRKYNLQIVNTVFLTDGEGSTLSHVVGANVVKPTHMVIRDPKTRHEEVFKCSSGYTVVNSMCQTDSFLRLLKVRTNSHVIGFFVGNQNDVLYRADHFFPELNEYPKDSIDRIRIIEQIKTDFKTTNSCIVSSTGYDDYYILRASGLDTDDEEELSFKENATTRGMVSAFSKHASKKISSRVVLNRFIDLIA